MFLVSTLGAFGALNAQSVRPLVEPVQQSALIATALSVAVTQGAITRGVPADEMIATDVSANLKVLRAATQQSKVGDANANIALPTRVQASAWQSYFTCPGAELEGRCLMNRNGSFMHAFRVDATNADQLSIWIARTTRTGPSEVEVSGMAVEVVFSRTKAGEWVFTRIGRTLAS